MNNTFFFPDDTLDYHEYGALTPYDIEEIFESFILDSVESNFEQVLIITGKGYVVRPAVYKLMDKNKYVESFKKAGYSNGQDGAYEVWLKQNK